MGVAYLWVEFGMWVGLDYGLGRHFRAFPPFPPFRCFRRFRHSAISPCPLRGKVEFRA